MEVEKKVDIVHTTVSQPKLNPPAVETNSLMIETSNLAIQAFLGDGSDQNPSHLDFRTWYHPDVCHYLLQLVPNQARCIRVIFSDAGYGNNTQTFKDQLQQLVMLGNALRLPAIFISKEPGADNHFICGLVKENKLLLINPLGITTKSYCYQTIFELKKEGTIGEVWFSSNPLQKHLYEEEGLVSCGAVTLELATHILSHFTPVGLETFWNQLKTNEPTTHEQSGLTYHGIDIKDLLPQILQKLETVSDKNNYITHVCLIRERHLQQLKVLPEQNARAESMATEEYLKTCKESALAQVLFNMLVMKERTIANIVDSPEYQSFIQELEKEVIPVVLLTNKNLYTPNHSQNTCVTQLSERSQELLEIYFKSLASYAEEKNSYKEGSLQLPLWFLRERYLESQGIINQLRQAVAVNDEQKLLIELLLKTQDQLDFSFDKLQPNEKVLLLQLTQVESQQASYATSLLITLIMRLNDDGLRKGILKLLDKGKSSIKVEGKKYSLAINDTLRKNSFIDFSNCNFSGLKKIQLNFSGLYLKKIRATNANLEGCSFRYTCLNEAVFKGANLSGADFTGAHAGSVNFSGANIENAKFINSYLVSAISKNLKEVDTADFTDAVLEFVQGDLQAISLSLASSSTTDNKKQELQQQLEQFLANEKVEMPDGDPSWPHSLERWRHQNPWSDSQVEEEWCQLNTDDALYQVIEAFIRQTSDQMSYTSPSFEMARLKDAYEKNELFEFLKKDWVQPPTHVGEKYSIKIDRIMLVKNKTLWKKYQTRKQNLEKELGLKKNTSSASKVSWYSKGELMSLPVLNEKTGECWLFHGTSQEVMPLITSGGFSTKFASKKWFTGYGALGKGIYLSDGFAKVATYVNCKLCKQNQCECDQTKPNSKAVFLTRALLGRTYIDRDKKRKQEEQLPDDYHSSWGPAYEFDNKSKFKCNEFLVRDESQVYPEVCIFYCDSSLKPISQQEENNLKEKTYLPVPSKWLESCLGKKHNNIYRLLRDYYRLLALRKIQQQFQQLDLIENAINNLENLNKSESKEKSELIHLLKREEEFLKEIIYQTQKIEPGSQEQELPHQYQLKYQYACYASECKHHGLAVSFYDQVVKQNPYAVEVYLERAFAYKELSQPSLFVRDINTAYLLDTIKTNKYLSDQDWNYHYLHIDRDFLPQELHKLLEHYCQVKDTASLEVKKLLIKKLLFDLASFFYKLPAQPSLEKAVEELCSYSSNKPSIFSNFLRNELLNILTLSSEEYVVREKRLLIPLCKTLKNLSILELEKLTDFDPVIKLIAQVRDYYTQTDKSEIDEIWTKNVIESWVATLIERKSELSSYLEYYSELSTEHRQFVLKQLELHARINQAQRDIYLLLREFPDKDGTRFSVIQQKKSWQEKVVALFVDSQSSSSNSTNSADIIIKSLSFGEHILNAKIFTWLKKENYINEKGEFNEAKQKEQKQGRHLIIPLQIEINEKLIGLHLKIEPELPGMDYAAHTLNKLLFGQGTAEMDIWRWRALSKKMYTLLVTETITIAPRLCQNFAELLDDPNGIEKKLEGLSSYYLTQRVLASFILNHNDGHPSNYLLELCEDSLGNKTLRLVCVDNDRCFFPAHVVDGKTEKIIPLVRDIILCLDMMGTDNILDRLGLEEFIQLDIFVILNKWFDQLYVYQDWCSKVYTEDEAKINLKKQQGIFSGLRSQEKSPTLQHILFYKGQIGRLFYKLKTLQDLLAAHPEKKPLDILNKLDKYLGKVYQGLFENPTARARFIKGFRQYYQIKKSSTDKQTENNPPIAALITSTSSLQNMAAMHGKPLEYQQLQQAEAYIASEAEEELKQAEEEYRQDLVEYLQNEIEKNDETLFVTFHNLPFKMQLRIINRLDYFGINETIQKKLFQYLENKHCETLRICNSNYLTRQVLDLILSKVHGLKHLSLSGCKNLTGNLGWRLERYCPELESCNLSHTGVINLSKRYTVSTIPLFKHLKELHIDYCDELIEIEINALSVEIFSAHNCHSLKKIAGLADQFCIDIELAKTYKESAHQKKPLGKHLEAIDDLNQAVILDPNNPEYYFLLGNVKFLLRNYIAAFDDYAKAIELSRNQTKYSHIERFILNQLEKLISKLIGDLKIIYTSDKLIQLYPGNQSYYNNRGNAKYNLQYYEAAIADYDQAIRLSPNNADYYFNRGKAKYALQRYEAAIADFDEAIRLDPDKAFYYHDRGCAKDDLQRYEAAISDFDQAIRLDPNKAFYYHNRGYAKSNLQRYEAAIADYDQAIRLDYNNAHYYGNRGIAKGKLQRYEAAILDHDEAIRLNPNNAYFYNNRGNAKQSLQSYKEAILDYDEAIRLMPTNGHSYTNRGNAKFNLQCYEAAILDHDEAIRLIPNNADYYANRAYAKYVLQRYEAAILDYDEAIRLNPNNIVYYNKRGDAKYALQRYEAAISDFDEAIRLNPNVSLYYYNRRSHAKQKLEQFKQAIADSKQALTFSFFTLPSSTSTEITETDLSQEEKTKITFKHD